MPHPLFVTMQVQQEHDDEIREELGIVNLRPKKITNLPELQTALDDRIHRHAQLQFSQWFKDHIRNGFTMGYKWRDMCKIFLHFLVYYEDYRFYERFSVPRMAMKRIVSLSWYIMQEFGQSQMSLLSWNERQQLAARHMSVGFKHCTLILDGTHTPCWVFAARQEIRSNHYSFKTKKSALNTQVAILNC